MIGELERLGMDTSEKVVNGILARRQETLPRLAQIVTSKKYWRGDDVWPAMCALHLLAKMNTYESRAAISASIRKYYDDTGDWLTEECPQLLAHMDVDAIDMLTEIIEDSMAGAHVKGPVACALIMIAVRHPEAKPGIVKSIKDVIRAEPNIVTRTLLIYSLIDMKDPSLYEYLKEIVQTGFIDDEMLDLEALDKIYANEEDVQLQTPMDPLVIFTYTGDRTFDVYRRAANYEAKAGRNEPCPCGSGKKYKKCCLKKTLV